MPQDRWREVDRVFAAVLDASEDAREAVIARECAADATLRAEVLRLLEADRRAEQRLGESATMFATPLLAKTRLEEDSPTAELEAALADRYAVEREISHGGMAIVYLARDLHHDRHVAVKVLAPRLAKAIGPERFRREIRIAGSLRHPNIVPVLDSGSGHGLTWYAMPFMEGQSLRQVLKREGKLPLDRALSIAEEAASALDHAYASGIVHRDIKPENILLSNGRAQVADFGIARIRGSETGARITAPGVALGTPAYMSPEQASGMRDLDGRSDQFSLGCVVFEMLAGHPPYSGPTFLHDDDPVPSLRESDPTITAGVDAAVARAMANDRSVRFLTAGDFVCELRSATSASSHD
jgi:serine/threonine-protein kinase